MTSGGGRPWLVTGGAGYIGAHVVERFVQSGRSVVVVDDLSTGLRERLPEGVPFVHASICDEAALRDSLERENPVGVIHLAAKKSPTESVADPLKYAAENVGGLVSLLAAMRSTRIERLVFSSSCSVYGAVEGGAVSEDTPLRPISPYGESKAYGERLLAAVAATGAMRVVALRYFNVAGALDAVHRDRSDLTLVPNVLRAAASGAAIEVFGTDYPTADGSCVRDYVDVRDLARAHVAAADATEADQAFRAFNVGTGTGSSVLEIIRAAERVTDRAIMRIDRPRRPGDPPLVVAAARLIEEALGWRAEHPLDEILGSVWAALRSDAEPR